MNCLQSRRVPFSHSKSFVTRLHADEYVFPKVIEPDPGSHCQLGIPKYCKNLQSLHIYSWSFVSVGRYVLGLSAVLEPTDN